MLQELGHQPRQSFRTAIDDGKYQLHNQQLRVQQEQMAEHG
jgi:hypothetical protein